MARRTKAQLDADIAALADFSDIEPGTVRTALENIKDTVNVSIPLTFGTVTSQPHLKLRTVSETGGNALDIPSGVEVGAAEGGFLIQSGDFFVEVPFADLLEIPVDATNDTVVDTSGSTQNAILNRGPSTGNGYESIYAGTTSGDKLLVLASSNDGTNTTDVTADINIWVIDHAHRGTFHRNDPSESAIAAQDKIGYFDNSESFEPPKLITFEDFKASLDVYSIPEWEATTGYVVGNTMRNSAGTKAYICKTAHTSGSSFPSGSTLTDNWVDLTVTGGGGTTLDAAGLIALLTAGTDIGIRADPNDNTKVEIRYTGTGGGGGTALNAQGLVDLIDNDTGNVDAAISSNDRTKVALTASAGSNYAAPVITDFTLDLPSNAANLQGARDYTLTVTNTQNVTGPLQLQSRSGKTGNFADVTGVTIGATSRSGSVTLPSTPIAVGGTRQYRLELTDTNNTVHYSHIIEVTRAATHEMAYYGDQSNDTWSEANNVTGADGMADVQSDTYSFDFNVFLQVNDYIWIAVPENRRPTSILNLGFGNTEDINAFTVADAAFSHGGVTYDVLSFQNQGTLPGNYNYRVIRA